jgi:hypothetical protein
MSDNTNKRDYHEDHRRGSSSSSPSSSSSSASTSSFPSTARDDARERDHRHSSVPPPLSPTRRSFGPPPSSLHSSSSMPALSIGHDVVARGEAGAFKKYQGICYSRYKRDHGLCILHAPTCKQAHTHTHTHTHNHTITQSHALHLRFAPSLGTHAQGQSNKSNIYKDNRTNTTLTHARRVQVPRVQVRPPMCVLHAGPLCPAVSRLGRRQGCAERRAPGDRTDAGRAPCAPRTPGWRG